jgi:hypothetical protein
MTTILEDDMTQTDQEGYPPATATITLRKGEFVIRDDISAPVNLLDLSVAHLMKQGLDHAFAFAILSERLRLYANGSASLGYGITATIEGHLGGHSG